MVPFKVALVAVTLVAAPVVVTGVGCAFCVKFAVQFIFPVIVSWTTGLPEQFPDQDEKDQPEAAEAASVTVEPAT